MAFKFGGQDLVGDIFISRADFEKSVIARTARIWGDNTNGQLGINNRLSRSSPVQLITEDGEWSTIDVCGTSSGVIKRDGTLWTWGNNTSGQLGTNNVIHRSSPVQTISAGTNWYRLAVGSDMMVAIKGDYTLWAWGDNTNGQLGDGTVVKRSSPVQIGAGVDWNQLSSVDGTVHALKTDGTLWGWGLNNKGQLGQNDTVDRSSPVQIGAGTDWSKISTGTSFALLLKTNGSLWVLGNNASGQLGQNNVILRSSPVQVGAGADWASISAGSDYATAVKTDGTLWLWGENSNGQLGDGTVVNRSSPIQTIAGGSNWVKCAGGAVHAAAVKTDGTLWTWGGNASGKLGDNSTVARSSPAQTVDTGSYWIDIDATNGVTTGIFIPV